MSNFSSPKEMLRASKKQNIIRKIDTVAIKLPDYAHALSGPTLPAHVHRLQNGGERKPELCMLHIAALICIVESTRQPDQLQVEINEDAPIDFEF